MVTIFGIIGMVTLVLGYLMLLTPYKKYYFHIGVISCMLYIIHGVVINDYTIWSVNIFMSIILIWNVYKKTEIK
jgi:membrane-bound ClpP family serine protease